jgi:tetratricopeptide (TPR) repeat protein
MTERRRPIINQRWQAAVEAADHTLAEIAAEIHRVSVEAGGRVLYPDKSTLAHWRTGTTPRTEAVPVIVEAMSRLMHRPNLTANDLGWSAHDHDRPDNPWRGDAVARLTRLGRQDMDRRSFLNAGSLYTFAALTVPARPWEMSARDRSGQAIRIGPADLARIREMTAQFSKADDLFGGDHALPPTASYLAHAVTPLLKGSTGRHRPELFTAAAQLAYLAGWMSSDAGRAGQAQRYYITAARLADEANNGSARATALRALALQAVELGHNQRAVELAEAACSALPHGADPRLRAWTAGMLAEAHAAAGDHWTARACLRSAEADVERATSAPGWTGGYGSPALEHQTGSILSYLGQPEHAIPHLRAALEGRSASERRSRVLISARLATAHLISGQPDAAAWTVMTIEQDIPFLTSQRAARQLADVRDGLPAGSADDGITRARSLIINSVR